MGIPGRFLGQDDAWADSKRINKSDMGEEKNTGDPWQRELFVQRHCGQWHTVDSWGCKWFGGTGHLAGDRPKN